MKNKTVWVCNACNSERVESREWVDLNTGEVMSGGLNEIQDFWCRNCSEHAFVSPRKDELLETIKA